MTGAASPRPPVAEQIGGLDASLGTDSTWRWGVCGTLATSQEVLLRSGIVGVRLDCRRLRLCSAPQPEQMATGRGAAWTGQVQIRWMCWSSVSITEVIKPPAIA